MARLIPPAAVLFDWDGTLVDTLPGLLAAHNHTRVLYGLLPWSHEDFMVNIKFSSREIFPSIYGDDWQCALEQLYDFVLAHHLAHLALMPGAMELIDYLDGQQVPMAIVSNKRQLILDREVDHLGWRDVFYCVLGSASTPRDKPSGDPLKLALSLKVKPSTAASVWFVGDMMPDLAAAREAGCPSVLLTHGEDKSALVDQYSPFLVVADCQALLARLQETFV